MFHSFVGLAAVLTSMANYMVEHVHLAHDPSALIHKIAVFLGILTGGVTFTGSMVAFAKLQGLMDSKPLLLKGHNFNNLAMAIASLGCLGVFVTTGSYPVALASLVGATFLSKILGVTLTSAIGGADMPVVITVLNSYSGWALCAEGFMMNNPLLTIVGALVGSSGAILSYIMCKAMNRSLSNVIFGGYSVDTSASTEKKEQLSHTEVNVEQAVETIVNSKSIIIVPGYGLAVAKA